MQVCKYIHHVLCGVNGGQKKAVDNLGLELQVVVRYQAGTEN